jgi:hypothetical protein
MLRASPYRDSRAGIAGRDRGPGSQAGDARRGSYRPGHRSPPFVAGSDRRRDRGQSDELLEPVELVDAAGALLDELESEPDELDDELELDDEPEELELDEFDPPRLSVL